MACFVSVLGDLGLGKTKTKRFSEMAQARKSHGILNNTQFHAQTSFMCTVTWSISSRAFEQL
jgi:hypothetical protein